MIRYIASQGFVLVVSAIVVMAALTVAYYLGSVDRIADELNIRDAEGVANISAILIPLFLVGLLGLAVVISWARIGLQRLRMAWWPAVGLGRLPDQDLRGVGEGLEAQQRRIASGTSWPAHEPKAKVAKSAGQVDFGDAFYSVALDDQRLVQRFLKRTRRYGTSQTVETDVLLVTGEPGAGKSVLTQEIHASLGAGLRAGFHSFVPVVVFAADLSAEKVAEFSGRKGGLPSFLAAYLRSTSPALDPFASFIERAWSQYDFLVIIDGLDEIAQRSAYEKIQRDLKDLFEEEFDSERRRVRRFILSCRIDDDIGIFAGAGKIVLRGLLTEVERERFCRNLISNEMLPSQSKKQLEAILSENSRSLSPVDVFRRNPYFLSLLLTYFKDRGPDEVEAQIDFQFLIQHYIAREIERPHAYLASSVRIRERRRDLRLALEPSASMFLSYLAFYMTSSEGDGTLYGTCDLSFELISGFVAATAAPTEASEGRWVRLEQLLDHLSADETPTTEDMNAYVAQSPLDEVDVRILRDLAATLGTRAAAASILGAISLLAHEARVETLDWYQRLARHLAAQSGPHLSGRRSGLAVLMMARGLAAAHVLRLIYVTEAGGAFTVRFRHRRLAEYYAATFFKDRWSELQPVPDSPWLTPVLNLVAAIEGTRCFALELFVSRLESLSRVSGFLWRGKVTDAAEATAFAHRGERFRALVSQMLQTFIVALVTLRQQYAEGAGVNAKRDLISEMTIVTALDFLAGLKIRDVALPEELVAQYYLADRTEAPQLILHSGKAATGLAKLTGVRAPLGYRLSLLRRAILNPIGLLGRKAEAVRSGLWSAWLLTVGYLAATEILLAAGLFWIVSSLWLSSVDLSSEAWSWMAAISVLITAGWCLVRLQWWFRSPTSAARINLLPLSLVLRPARAGLHAVKSASTGQNPLRELVPEGQTLKTVAAGAGGVILPAFIGFVFVLGLSTGGYLLVRAMTAAKVIERPQEPAAVIADEGEALRGPEERNGCDRAVAARDRLLAFTRASGNLADIRQAREEISRVRDQIETTARVDNCTLAEEEYEGQTLADDAIEVVLERDRYLLPLPGEGRYGFYASDFSHLRSLLAAELPPTSKVSPFSLRTNFRRSSEASERRELLAASIVRLRKARARGQVSEAADGRVLGDYDSTITASAVTDLLVSAKAELRAVEVAEDQLRSKARESVIICTALIPLAGILLWLLVNWWKQRADGARFRQLKDESVGVICSALASEPMSDRLRGRLTRVIHLREGVGLREVGALEDLVQRLSARKSPRDTQFAVDLGSAVTDLTTRLGRRV